MNNGIIVRNPSKLVIFWSFFNTFVLIGIWSALYYFYKQVIESEIYKGIINNLSDFVDYKHIQVYQDNEDVLLLGVTGLLMVVIPILILLYKYVYNKTTTYTIDLNNKYILIETGIFSKDVDNITFDKVLDVGSSRNPLELMFGKKTIKLFTRGDLSSGSEKLTSSERKQIQQINSTVQFGYISLKKLKSIPMDGSEEIENQIRRFMQSSNSVT